MLSSINIIVSTRKDPEMYPWIWHCTQTRFVNLFIAWNIYYWLKIIIIMFWSCNCIKAAFKIYPLLLREKLKFFFWLQDDSLGSISELSTLSHDENVWIRELMLNVDDKFNINEVESLKASIHWMMLYQCTSFPMVHLTLSDVNLFDLKTSLTWWLYVFVYFK